MKKMMTSIGIMVLLLAMTGCSERMKEDIKDSIEEVKENTKEAVDNLTDELRENIRDSIMEDMDSDVDDNDIDENDDSDNDDNNVTDVSYYGTWTVDSIAGTSAVYAMTEEDQNKLLGKILILRQNSCTTIEGAEIAEIIYDTEYIDAKDFEEDYRVTFEALGITDSRILEVEIEDAFFFGSESFLIDEYTLYIYYDGVFFQMTRVE